MSRCQNDDDLVCENGGSCRERADGLSECVCFGGYSGRQCQYPPRKENDGKYSNRFSLELQL